MLEIEIKARSRDHEKQLMLIEFFAGKGRAVDKRDHYFHIEGSDKSSLRIRRYNGVIEFTVKKRENSGGTESNEEHEFQAPIDEYQKAVGFFHVLGYSDYFEKNKRGWEWTYQGIHIELLEVNDLGYFLEMEALLPFDADDRMKDDARSKLKELLHLFGLEDKDIERRSYRSMILGR